MLNCRAGGRLVVVIVGAGVVAGCAHPNIWPAPPPPTPTPPVYYEESIPPLARARIEVVDFQDRPTADKARVTVSGTVVNRGHATTMALRIKISGLDKDGKTIDSIEAVPSTELVPPGDTARFSATLPNDLAIVRYQVEAFAR